jgi:hypothetical protein
MENEIDSHESLQLKLRWNVIDGAIKASEEHTAHLKAQQKEVEDAAKELRKEKKADDKVDKDLLNVLK